MLRAESVCGVVGGVAQDGGEFASRTGVRSDRSGVKSS